MTSPLDEKLRGLIAAGGPLSVADYMAACLFDPEHGYYTTKEPFGGAGDFTTAPEISQMFGEIIGAWLVHVWTLAGSPKPFVLAEMGPGRGTLMRDILRTAKLAPEFLDAVQVHLIEASPRLREIQQRTLQSAPAEIAWCERLGELPDLPLLLVANELFDAIPFRQFQKTQAGWCERKVGLGEDGALAFVLAPPAGDASFLPVDADHEPEGSVFEFAPAREAIAADIADHIARHGGAALFIDYGHLESGYGDTFQAVRRHEYTPVLDNPGEADLTSHVDFGALAAAATQAGAVALPAVTQGDFLLKLGLLERAGALGHGKDRKTQDAIREAVERLAGTGPDQMGSLFKAMCLTSGLERVPPFDGA